MKIRFLAAALVLAAISLTSASAFAQANCYEEYIEVFRERGASDVPDGIHEAVVSIRSGNKCDCYMAKVEVKDNAIKKTLGLILIDGSVKNMGVNLSEKYTDPNNPAKLYTDIYNGMSATFLSDDNRLINIFFIGQLNPKTKAVKVAPSAKTL